MKLKSKLVVHSADSSAGRKQLILWLERQAKFLRRNSPAKFGKRFVAKLFLDSTGVMLSKKGM